MRRPRNEAQTRLTISTSHHLVAVAAYQRLWYICMIGHSILRALPNRGMLSYLSQVMRFEMNGQVNSRPTRASRRPYRSNRVPGLVVESYHFLRPIDHGEGRFLSQKFNGPCLRVFKRPNSYFIAATVR